MNKLQEGADGFQLKLFALISMTIDHIHYFIPGMPFWLTCVGRLAAPVFLFLCAEGFSYTRSRPKYLMYLFAVGMRLASMLLSGMLPRPDGTAIMNDMFSTMFVVCWCVEGIELLRGKEGKRWHGALMLAGMLAATALVIVLMPAQGVPLAVRRLSFLLLPNPFTCEGSVLWAVLGVLFFYTRRSRKLTALLMAGFTLLHLLLVPWEPQTLAMIGCTFAAAVPLCLYNGKPGKHRCKWLFYTYYPAHVYALYVLGWLLQTA